jgi:hypothetical protein
MPEIKYLPSLLDLNDLIKFGFGTGEEFWSFTTL